MENSRPEEAHPIILEEIFPETPEKQNDVDFDRISEFLSNQGFSIADISIEQGTNPILTNAFINTSENIDSVEHLQKTLSEWFPEQEVKYSRNYLESYRETAVFPETQLLSVKL